MHQRERERLSQPAIDDVIDHLRARWDDRQIVENRTTHPVNVMCDYAGRDQFLGVIEQGMIREMGAELMMRGLALLTAPTITWWVSDLDPHRDGVEPAESAADRAVPIDPRTDVPPAHDENHYLRHLVCRISAYAIAPYAAVPVPDRAAAPSVR